MNVMKMKMIRHVIKFATTLWEVTIVIAHMATDLRKMTIHVLVSGTQYVSNIYVYV